MSKNKNYGQRKLTKLKIIPYYIKSTDLRRTRISQEKES